MKRMLQFVLDVVREYGTNDPNIIIKELNIPVYESWACTLLRVNGFYTKANKKQAIFTEPSLNKMQKDVVLAHELGHIKLKHHHARLAFDLLSDEQKEVLYYLFVKQYSTARLAAIRGQSDRNIRKLRMTIQKKLQKRMYERLSEKLENDHGLTLREREFVEEYEALLQTMGKDAVIRRENKTKPRKKKAALDDAKDG